MSTKRNILLVSSEMTGLAKTGGLADVTAALAVHLKQRGHDVRVVLPFYQMIAQRLGERADVVLPMMCVHMGNREEWCSVRHVEGFGAPLYLIEHEAYFNRHGLYHDSFMNDYDDNPRRFGFFARAALQYCMDSGFQPDVVHCNDWQTALIPAYLKNWFWDHPLVGPAASVLTIHNIAYQGVYPPVHYPYLGLGDEHFTADKFESFEYVNFLKGGLHFADMVNTVSPSFAREIVQPYQGFGLAPYLSDKGSAFQGVLNGVDYEVWSPESDRLIPAQYSVKDRSGKAACKRALQESFSLELRDDVPVIGSVGRFVHQKGYQLLRDCIERVLHEMDVQLVVLGSGDYELSDFFGYLPVRYGGRFGSYIGYSEELSHLIEAGCDFFVMPSLFEPCGLNQLYSLRYGTLPIVRATGGLDDTVEQYNEYTGEGTGFKFWEPDADALANTMGWAVSTWYDRHEHIEQMITRAMQQDFSWERAVKDYEQLYTEAMRNKREYDQGWG